MVSNGLSIKEMKELDLPKVMSLSDGKDSSKETLKGKAHNFKCT
jgi:hypothetical protein